MSVRDKAEGKETSGLVKETSGTFYRHPTLALSRCLLLAELASCFVDWFNHGLVRKMRRRALLMIFFSDTENC